MPVARQGLSVTFDKGVAGVLAQQPLPIFLVAQQVSEIAQAFAPVKVTQDEIHVSMTEIFQSQFDGKLLVETYIKEEPLTQRLALLIRQREKGDYVVKLHEVGFPRPTIGVQIAIAYLATWLKGLHPENAFVRSSLDEEYLKIGD